jgi:hypothetical protein
VFQEKTGSTKVEFCTEQSTIVTLTRDILKMNHKPLMVKNQSCMPYLRTFISGSLKEGSVMVQNKCA